MNVIFATKTHFCIYRDQLIFWTDCMLEWHDYYKTVLFANEQIVAHEMGHNMGMLHDFDSEHGGQNGPCNGQGIMSYGSAPNVWSNCSRDDFKALYNSIIGSSDLQWCLDGMSTYWHITSYTFAGFVAKIMLRDRKNSLTLISSLDNDWCIGVRMQSNFPFEVA